MARMPVFGTCRICGFNKKLSFEHVPPEAAFNDRPIREIRGEVLINADLDKIAGKISQRGSGSYTLCEKCNNDTGSWYGTAFAHWTYQAMHILRATHGNASLYYTYHIFPLRIIKQIICMFFSATGPQFSDGRRDLVHFVLNKNATGVHPRYRIYAYFNNSRRSRQTGITGRLNFDTHTIQVMSEISFPPLGYLMTFESSSPDDRLIDISFMAQFHYNDWEHISLRLPVLPVYTFLPGDYRDRDRVLTGASR
jgi:hypothetical protein